MDSVQLSHVVFIVVLFVVFIFHVVTRVRFIKYDNEVTDRQTGGIVIPMSRSV